MKKEIQIHGLNKLTMLDYPGLLACTLFTGYCNFLCPYCQNASLVLAPSSQPVVAYDEIMNFLKSRVGMLEGVCITGGEPTMFPEALYNFIKEVKKLGYKVKLDTNGSHPDILEKLIDEGLLDYVAMDIKSSRENYAAVCGKSGDKNFPIKEIKKSVELIMNRMPDYEFRTTTVEELHKREDFEAMTQWLSGAKVLYLQSYTESDDILINYDKKYAEMGFKFHAFKKEQLEEFAEILRKRIRKVEIRGV